MPTRIECPHCSTVTAYDPVATCFHERYADERTFQPDADGYLGVNYQLCPACNKYVLHITDGRETTHLVWPNSTVIQPLSDLIPAKYARDYEEAAAVISISPKASAALTRRCLQHFLESEATANERWPLEKQIEHATGLSPPIFPARLAAKLDHVRIIGNFAAHPKKSTNTGEVMDVEPDEAAYLLEVLAEVLVHQFIEPPRDAARNAAINQKIAEARKLPKP